MTTKRSIFIGTGIVFTAFCLWATLSLQDDDSSVSVTARFVARYLKETVCWSAQSNAFCVIKAMAKYEKKGRYENAITTGVEWTDKHYDALTSPWIYEDISALCVEKARMDSGRAEEYLKQAVSYRDKAVRSVWETPYSLQRLVTISESIGDVSATQRCGEYGTSIKLLDRMKLLADEDKDRLARQFKPDVAERKKVDYLLDWIDARMKRVGGKLSASGCQQEHRSPG